MSVPHEPEAFINALIADIHSHVLDPRCILSVGCGDGYELGKIAAAFEGCKGVGVDATEGDAKTVIAGVTGVGHFYLYEPGLSSIYLRSDKRKPKGSQRVLTLSLDDFCWLHEIQPDVLMIDAEGATDDVLWGGTETLKSVSLIAAETETEELFQGQKLDADVNEWLTVNGFKRIRIEEARGVPQRNSVWVRA